MRTLSYTLRMLNGLNTFFRKENGFVPLLFIFVTFLYIASVTGVCKNVGPNNDENLANTCDWSSWYSWNCSCCSADNTQFQFRKRAICCDENESLPVCLSNCNYTEDSDTMFANCSQDCVPKDGEKCTQTAPVNITLMLPSSMPISTDLTSTMTTEVNRQSTDVLYSSNTTFNISKSTLASITSVSGTSSTVSLSTPTNDTASSMKYLTTSSSNTSIDSSNSSMSPPIVSSDILSTEYSVLPMTEPTSSLSNYSTQVGTSGSVQVSVGAILGVVGGCLVFLAVLVSIIILLKRKKLKSAVEPDMNAEDAELTHRDYSEHIANKEIPTEIYHNQID